MGEEEEETGVEQGDEVGEDEGEDEVEYAEFGLKTGWGVCTVRCTLAVQKVGCFPLPVARGPRVLNSAPLLSTKKKQETQFFVNNSGVPDTGFRKKIRIIKSMIWRVWGLNCF